MTYQIIRPPFTLMFDRMSKKDLREYAKWFHGISSERISCLAKAVSLTSGFRNWKADFSPTSLEMLGEWFALQVETCPRTPEEVKAIGAASLLPWQTASEELTNRTFSLAIDIGMYIANVFLKNHPSLSWDQQLMRKNSIDYGQPVLVGFRGSPFNPVQMMVTFAYALANKMKEGRSLRELYDTWAKLIESRSEVTN